jgi:glutathione S-transferase
MSLVFYYSPMSSATPVQWSFEELGVPHEKVLIDLQAGDQRKPEFLAINPNGKVPTIVHDGTPIFESAAIQIYLGETFGVEKGLFPAPGPKRGEAMKWIVWANVAAGEALSRLFRNTSDRVPAEQRNPKAAEVARADLGGLLRMLDDALKGKEYLLGTFSLVDVHLSSWIDYVGMTGVDLKPHAAMGAWLARCCERPAYKKVMGR